MTVMDAARQLGVALQEDERFQNYMKAQKAVETDEQVNALGENLTAIQTAYDEESLKETPDEAAMANMIEEYKALYQTLHQTPAMIKLLDAREYMDGMMNEIMNFLYLVIGGADPRTVEVTAETMQRMQAEMMQMQQ